MPFYIRDIGPESSWYDARERFIGKEIAEIKELDLADKSLPHFKGTLVNMNDIYCTVLILLYITVSWEDYPSEECRAGMLDKYQKEKEETKK